MAEIRNILIYRVGNLGDTVCAIPAMVAVRKRFPEARITLLTDKAEGQNPDSQKVLSGNDFLDEIITYSPGKLRNIAHVLDLRNKIAELRVDLLVYLALSRVTTKRLIRDFIFFKSSSCSKCIGFKRPKPIDVVTGEIDALPIYPQEVDRLMSLLIPLGINPAIIDFDLPMRAQDKLVVDQYWFDHKVSENSKVVAVCPGAKFPAKLWPVERFIEVILHLQMYSNVKIVLVGGPGETASGSKIVQIVGDTVVNLIGKTTYMQTAELLSRCDLLVANDCGPVHLAAAVATPVVGVYSSIAFPGAWHPWGKNHTVLRNDSVPCRFCFQSECSHMSCINGIKSNQVVDACLRYLS